MALNAALVDQARVLGRAATETRVEGTTVYEVTESAWFKARLELGRPGGQQAPVTRASQSLKAPTLMYGVKDSEGRVIEVNGADKIEVKSKELGTEVYECNGDPEPMRKKRKVIGWEVSLTKVVIHKTPGLEP